MDLAILVSIIAAVVLIGGFVGYRIIFNPFKISRIRECLAKEQFFDAIRISQKMLEKDADNPMLHYLLAEAYYFSDNSNAARAEYNYLFRYDLATTDIDEINVRFRLSNIYLANNAVEDALKELLLIAKKKPDNLEIMLKIGDIFKEKDKWDNAYTFYQKALAIDKSNTKAIFSLGEALFNKKQYKLALKFLAAAMKQTPNSPDANYFAGLCYKALGDPRNAIIYLKRSATDKRLGLNSLYSIGTIYFEQKQYTDSVEAFKRAIALIEDKKSATFLGIMYALGEGYQRLNMIRESIDCWEQIYAIKNNYKDIIVKLSKFQYLKDDDDIRDFLVANNDKFQEIGKKIIHHFGCKIIKLEMLASGKMIEAQTLGSTSAWKNMDKLPVFFQIIRDISEPIGKANVGDVLDKMKITKSAKGYIISPSYTLPEAEGTMSTRPIEIIDRAALSQLLVEIKTEVLDV